MVLAYVIGQLMSEISLNNFWNWFSTIALQIILLLGLLVGIKMSVAVYKKRKIGGYQLLNHLFTLIGGIVTPGILFGVIATFIGGNFFTDFEFRGVRGYEATFQVGFFMGLAVGFLLYAVLMVRNKGTD